MTTDELNKQKISSSNMQRSHQHTPLQTAQNSPEYRLPCRGCTVDCTNFDRCGGALWRIK